MITYRKATSKDKCQIAFCIAEAYKEDFKDLKKSTEIISEALQSGIQTNRFYVAKDENDLIVGISAISDCTGRSVLTDKKSYKKHFGFIMGTIVCSVFRDLFEKQLNYNKETGYIEFVGVLPSFQRKGISTKLLDYSIKNSKYNKYVLDVTDINIAAYKCYKKYGFCEYKRVKVNKPKKYGFNEKVYMQYIK